jgi:hypothetical protein
LIFHFEYRDAVLQRKVCKVIVVIIYGVAVVKVVYACQYEAALPTFAVKPKSTFNSPQSVVNASAEKEGRFLGFSNNVELNRLLLHFRIMRKQAFTTSILSNSEFGIQIHKLESPLTGHPIN